MSPSQPRGIPPDDPTPPHRRTDGTRQQGRIPPGDATRNISRVNTINSNYGIEVHSDPLATFLLEPEWSIPSYGELDFDEGLHSYDFLNGYYNRSTGQRSVSELRTTDNTVELIYPQAEEAGPLSALAYLRQEQGLRSDNCFASSGYPSRSNFWESSIGGAVGPGSLELLEASFQRYQGERIPRPVEDIPGDSEDDGWTAFDDKGMLPYVQSPPPQPAPPGEQVIQHRDRGTLRLICHLIVTKYITCGSGKWQLGSPGSGSGDQSHSPDSTISTSDLPPQSSSHGSQKRTQQGPGPSQEPFDASRAEGSETDHKKRRRFSQPRPLLYACPFYRKDPDSELYASGGRFEKCRSKGIKTDKLKEHIRRIHTKPAQCETCGRRGDPGDIRKHTQKVKCSPKTIEKVDDETLQKERLLEKRGNTSWHRVFGILFPNHFPAPLESAQYVDGEGEHDRQRLENILIASLERATAVTEVLLRSPEYKAIDPLDIHSTAFSSPALTAAATKLISIISSSPFLPDARSFVTTHPTNLGHTAQSSPELGTPPAPATESYQDCSPQIGLTGDPDQPKNPSDVSNRLLSSVGGCHADDDNYWESVDWDMLGDWLNPDVYEEG